MGTLKGGSGNEAFTFYLAIDLTSATEQCHVGGTASLFGFRTPRIIHYWPGKGLLRKFINYEQKKFYNIGPGVNVKKLFFSVTEDEAK